VPREKIDHPWACVTEHSSVWGSKLGETVHKRAEMSIGPQWYSASGHDTEEWNKGHHSPHTYIRCTPRLQRIREEMRSSPMVPRGV
jgi:hypothetical protein